jgi:hypothetical protein
MKNVHLIPTDKPSRLYKHNELGFELLAPVEHEIGAYNGSNQNIYITSNEEIKIGDKGWLFEDSYVKSVCEFDCTKGLGGIRLTDKKIILTTDQDLIADGVQAIDDNFLQWFVKNPSCEWVEVEEVYPLNCCIKKEGKTKMNNGCMERNRCLNYKIIIPK